MWQRFRSIHNDKGFSVCRGSQHFTFVRVCITEQHNLRTYLHTFITCMSTFPSAEWKLTPKYSPLTYYKFIFKRNTFSNPTADFTWRRRNWCSGADTLQNQRTCRQWRMTSHTGGTRQTNSGKGPHTSCCGRHLQSHSSEGVENLHNRRWSRGSTPVDWRWQAVDPSFCWRQLHLLFSAGCTTPLGWSLDWRDEEQDVMGRWKGNLDLCFQLG